MKHNCDITKLFIELRTYNISVWQMKTIIRREVRAVLKQAVALRHRLHQIPEESFKEKLTAQLLVQELKESGIEVTKEGVAQTGIVATITGTRPGRVVALRADMDGLKIMETTGKPYESHCPGRAHSCGHDGHMVCVLEAGRILARLRDRLAGTVRLIFQPGEEGTNGAQLMVKEGALGSRLPAAIFSLHAWPYLECGVVAAKPGFVTYGNDRFTIKVKGRGGHGARPHETISPILSAARIVRAISDLTRYDSDGRPLCVISVGVIRGGRQHNTIPDETTIRGTIRSMDETIRQEILTKFGVVIAGIADQDSVRTKIHYDGYCPAVYNQPDLYSLFETVTGNLLGSEKVDVLSEQSTGSDDFGVFSQQVPTLLFRLGMGTACAPLHSGNFDFADAALESGITILVGLALQAAKKRI